MGITFHLMDDWKLRSLMVSLKNLKDEHTGKNICHEFIEVCERFGVIDKVRIVSGLHIIHFLKLQYCK